MSEKSVQERYAPHNACFGCGPANPKGLRIRSFPDGDGLRAAWTAEEHHEAFPGMLNGGILGALLDCHSNWTAAWTLMQRSGSETPPCTVTANYAVKLHRPTPSSAELEIYAEPIDVAEDRARIRATIHADSKLCASCEGLFVAVQPGHPAYHRW
jgi:acyl-coenzyme A thioesterase PaaI-like protein